MKLLHFTRRFRLGSQELFHLEQWTALPIGMVCLGVSAWAGFSGFGGSASVPRSWFAESVLATMKCSLTIAVALIGTALVRFAFYKPQPKNPAAPAQEERRTEEDTKGDNSGGSTRLKLIALHKERG